MCHTRSKASHVFGLRLHYAAIGLHLVLRLSIIRGTSSGEETSRDEVVDARDRVELDRVPARSHLCRVQG